MKSNQNRPRYNHEEHISKLLKSFNGIIQIKGDPVTGALPHTEKEYLVVKSHMLTEDWFKGDMPDYSQYDEYSEPIYLFSLKIIKDIL